MEASNQEQKNQDITKLSAPKQEPLCIVRNNTGEGLECWTTLPKVE